MHNKGKSLKILHASRESKSDQRYGMGRANARLLSGLQQIGVPTDFFCTSDLSTHSLKSIDSWAKRFALILPLSLHSIVSVIVSAWQVGREAALKAVRENYTHLHCHDAIVAAGARSILGGQGIAWGVTQHGFHCIALALHRFVQPLPFWFRWLLWQWERQTLKSADWIVCPTQLGCMQLAQELHLLLDVRWRSIPHAAPELKLTEKSEARQILGWSNDLYYIVALGQLIPLKRFDLIIQAMKQLPSNIRLVLLGDGDPEPYSRLASDLGIPVPIVTATDEVGIYLSAADVFVSASATESFGMAILEAMTAGLPIICTNVGGVSEVVGPAAILAEPDGSDLTACLLSIFSDSDQRARLNDLARVRAADWPDGYSVAQCYLALYRSVSHH